MHPELQYHQLLKLILSQGSERIDRTKVGTKAIFGQQMRFDLTQGFPVFTSKRVYWKSAFKEMLWMLSGATNIRELLVQNVHIWSEWPHQQYCKKNQCNISLADFEAKVLNDDVFARQWGELGPIYGKQWRRWKTEDGREIDQIQQVIEALKDNPASRRILFESWNVGELDQMALPPCHKHYQFYVDPQTNQLSGGMVQRSVDCFLGLPFNIANLALLTSILAQQTNYEVGEIVWFGFDTHIYSNHMTQVNKLLTREPKPFPKLMIKNKAKSLFDYRIDDFELSEYHPHPAISAPVAV